VVRAFAREPYEINRFDEMNKTYFDARVRVVSSFWHGHAHHHHPGHDQHHPDPVVRRQMVSTAA